MKRIISWILCLAFLVGVVPLAELKAFAEDIAHEAFTIDNGYVKVNVSKENGGFTINTAEGDQLKKSDNNKDLLYHNGQYDTSFVSFKVTSGSDVNEYIFGGKYGDASDPSRNGVTVSQAEENGEIIAEWSVGELTFAQSITLANPEANEHGMVSIQLAVQNSGSQPAQVEARVLYDTNLGGIDYGYYQVRDNQNVTHTITTEQVLDGASYNIPQNFYATNDPYDPTVIAYSVNAPQATPSKIAFGHWNNLASTLFDFGPDGTLDFTSYANDNLTQDSAYALYYDLGNVDAQNPKSMITYYGVYSNKDVSVLESVSVNISAPLKLELNDEKTDFVRLVNQGSADFSAGVSFENFASDTAQDFSQLTMAIRTTGNLRILEESGAPIADYGFESGKHYTVQYTDVAVGDVKSSTLYFDARLSNEATYERISITLHDTSQTGGNVTENNKVGEKTVYILLPGSDGNVPKVNFVSMTPDIIYYSGTRHLYVAITNESMLTNTAVWTLSAYSLADRNNYFEIPHNNITVKDGIMDVAFTEDMVMSTGGWYLELKWSDAAVEEGVIPPEHQIQTAPELHFTVSEDKKYKNECYGVLAIVEYKENSDPIYKIEKFADEDKFKEFEKSGEFIEILMVFRGEFTTTHTIVSGGKTYGSYFTGVSSKTIDADTRTHKVDNPITINNAIDFEGGTISIYYEDYTHASFERSNILVEFDGELYTSDARTTIWKGKAAFSKIEQGKRISLIRYNKNGVRKNDFEGDTITLVWPAAQGIGQTLAGLLFQLAYGELGVMINDDGTEIGRVLSFSGCLDLSFVSPGAANGFHNDPWEGFSSMWKNYKENSSVTDYVYSAGYINRMKDIAQKRTGGFNAENQAEASQNYVNDDPQSIAASVVVQDILFGCGEGFVGLNFEVALAIENYIDALPEISGRLKINTINDWAFSFNGGMQLATFALEAQLSFKSHNDIPVPDKIYFYVGGFKPGINIDSFGVVWITGGGGGISNLYDTIFLTQAVPPLKLILSVGFSIIQVLDGKATLSLGLTGVSVTGEDLKILGVIEAVRRVHLGLEWYPGIELEASISLNIFQGVISGGGYIILIGENYNDWFFEMFARAAVGIPNFVPIVGGMSIGSVDLGINSDKIWGSAKVLFVAVGITYYWGDSSVDFGTGGTKAKPSFPELLGKEDIPVYYDAERDQTLYARIGTNISEPIPVEVIDLTEGVDLMAAGVASDPSFKLHRFNLGEYNNADNNAAILQATYDATSLEDAKNKARSFKINSARTLDGQEYPISFYEGVAGTENTVNSNVTFNEDTGKASFSFTVTNSEDYNKDWYISSGEVETSVVLYNVEPIPEVTSVSAQSPSSGQMTVTWDGSKLNELDSISFYLIEESSLDSNNEPIINADGSMDGGHLVDILDTSAEIASKSATLTVPADLPSGDYRIRAVYSKMDEVNGSIIGDTAFSYTNSLTPQQAAINNVKPAGNLEFAVEIAETDDPYTTGYSVTVYNQDGTATDVAGLTFDKVVGDTTFNVGGSYEHEGVRYGLVGGNRYKIGITPYNLVDTNADNQPDTVVYGTEIISDEILLPEMTTPKADFSADVQPVIIEHDHDNDPSTEKVKVDTYTKADITFTAQLDEIATGSWKLNDNGISDSFTDSDTINIPLTDLTDGSHTITVTGKDTQGDTFMQSYRFDVDTVAPKLLVSSPVNGQLFNKNGTLSITGVTDYDAIFTVKVDDTIVVDKKTVSDLGGTIGTDGVFKFDIQIPDPNASSSRKITITAEDKAKNSVVEEATVAHGALADVDKLEILVDGQEISSGNISVSPVADSTHKLTLIGKTKEGMSFILPTNNISWAVLPVVGNASADTDGTLDIEANSQGMIVGRLQVASNASRTAAISFGAEIKEGLVSVSSSIGGSVTGSGQYNPGDTVTLTATPDNGYNFAGWTLIGVTVPDTNATTITFQMPPTGNVTVMANFTAISSTGGGSYSSKGLKLNAGKYAEVTIPSSADENGYVPYYYGEGKEKIYVPMSATIGGKLVFIAPVTAEYFFEENKKLFDDTDSHWAEPNIDFTTARELFNGISEKLFDPDGSMTRAMFVTVLYRLDGKPEVSAKASFDDVLENSWYEDAVSWANANGIVNGISETEFAPDVNVTREQMCALIARYLSYKGYALESGNGITFSDKDSISDWAMADVEKCVAAEIITGYPDNTFKPQASATRAENCTVLRRVIQNILKNTVK